MTSSSRSYQHLLLPRLRRQIRREPALYHLHVLPRTGRGSGRQLHAAKRDWPVSNIHDSARRDTVSHKDEVNRYSSTARILSYIEFNVCSIHHFLLSNTRDRCQGPSTDGLQDSPLKIQIRGCIATVPRENVSKAYSSALL